MVMRSSGVDGNAFICSDGQENGYTTNRGNVPRVNSNGLHANSILHGACSV